MSLFVEVHSKEKNCPVIVNLDHVVEIAPLAAGGCALFTADGAGMNSKNAMVVSNEYSEFKQFAMQTVSAEDIARRFPKVVPPEVEQKQESKSSKKKDPVDAPLEIPKL